MSTPPPTPPTPTPGVTHKLSCTSYTGELKMTVPILKIRPVYMNFWGKFWFLFIYNKQSKPLIRGLLKEPSDRGLHCLQRSINRFPALKGLIKLITNSIQQHLYKPDSINYKRKLWDFKTGYTPVLQITCVFNQLKSLFLHQTLSSYHSLESYFQENMSKMGSVRMLIWSAARFYVLYRF